MRNGAAGYAWICCSNIQTIRTGMKVLTVFDSVFVYLTLLSECVAPAVAVYAGSASPARKKYRRSTVFVLWMFGGDSHSNPCELPMNRSVRVTDVSAGEHHTAMLTGKQYTRISFIRTVRDLALLVTSKCPVTRNHIHFSWEGLET